MANKSSEKQRAQKASSSATCSPSLCKKSNFSRATNQRTRKIVGIVQVAAGKDILGWREIIQIMEILHAAETEK